MSAPTGMVLGKPAIIDAVNNGSIFISNFDERQVNNSSYDVRLGEWFFEEQPIKGWSLLDPYHPETVKAMFGEPKKAIVPGAGYPITRGVDRGVIALPPGGFFLAHTEEFIGAVDNIHTTMIKARSTTGRNGVQVCACAGWGDIGYATRWTLELKNNTKRTVILRPGQRIGQIVFIPTTGVEDTDLYHIRGKYQDSLPTGKTHEELCSQWNPSSMLPKAWEDWDAERVVGSDDPEPIKKP